MSTVTIVDFGAGNMLSVNRAFAHLGAEIVVTEECSAIARAKRLVLPGVAAFSDAMAGLRARGLIGALGDYARSGRPLLGICVGMQMLFERSHEFGLHEGLGLLPGEVAGIPSQAVDGSALRVPHIGWSPVRPPQGVDWNGSLLAGSPAGSAFYFVHSFHARPGDPSHRLAVCEYGGQEITAAVRAGNIHGCQFHPEKSAEGGLSLLRAFLDTE